MTLPRSDRPSHDVVVLGSGAAGLAAALAAAVGGAGGTLGPAMTFGYLAGRDAAG